MCLKPSIFWCFETLIVTTSLPTDEQCWGEAAPGGVGQFYSSAYSKGVYFSHCQLPLLPRCQPECSMASKAARNVGRFQLDWPVGSVQFPGVPAGMLMLWEMHGTDVVVWARTGWL